MGTISGTRHKLAKEKENPRGKKEVLTMTACSLWGMDQEDLPG
jgi:hypothetical protein